MLPETGEKIVISVVSQITPKSVKNYEIQDRGLYNIEVRLKLLPFLHRQPTR